MMDTKIHIDSEENIIWYQSKPIYEMAKRLFDLLLSILLLVVLLVPMGILALAIRLDSSGPVLYRQTRLGLSGVPFTLLKFRTMTENAECGGPVWAAKDDPRRTKIGVFLRRFHLDELPQLWNIFIGDMSFVGPRPEREIFYQTFGMIVADFDKRLLVKPGLTGLAQISGGYDLTPAEKWRYDMQYIGNRSVLLDIRCLVLTFPTVLTGRGAR